jgi:hypothetical protein
VSAVNVLKNAASSDRRIELILSLDKRYRDKIRSDSRAVLMSGIVGPYVDISPGVGGRAIEPDGEIRFIPITTLPENAFSKVFDCLQAIKAATEDKQPIAAPSSTKTSQ